MKKIFKGCLWTFVVIFGLLIIVGIALFFYLQSPNKIRFTDGPIKKEVYLNSLSFPGRQLPDLVLNQNDNDILYQAFIKDDGLDKTVIYKVVIKLQEDAILGASLPLNLSDWEEINDKIAFNDINNNVFNPQIKIPADKKTQSGRHLTVYTGQKQISMPLNNGSYSYSHTEIDQDGYVSDIIIYDKDTKLLYFERQRYYAFQ
jgi:hypothetical protein